MPATPYGGGEGTSLLVLVPVAEPIAGPHRLRYDDSTAWGVPSHVTVLHPFMPAALVDDDVLARLAALFAAVPAFTATFRRTAWFGEEVLFLAPEPAEPFVALTAAVAAAFPEYPPYEGAYDGEHPHLTLAHTGTVEQHRAVEAAVQPQLPIAMDVRSVQLVQGSEEPHSFRVRASLPLG
jgi:2'-5' RNA ligase